MPKISSLNDKGMSLIELTIMSGLALGAIVGMMKMGEFLHRNIRTQEVKYSFTRLSDYLKTAMDDNDVWAVTVADVANTALNCRRAGTDCCTPVGNPACTPETGKIKLHNYPGVADPLIYNTDIDTARGFTSTGQPCDTFTVGGNSVCPIQLSLTWTALCPGGGRQPCLNPGDQLALEVTWTDKVDVFQINTSDVAFTRRRGQILSADEYGGCAGTELNDFVTVSVANAQTKSITLSDYPTARCLKVYCEVSVDNNAPTADKWSLLLVRFKLGAANIAEYQVCGLQTWESLSNGVTMAYDSLLPIPRTADSIEIEGQIFQGATVSATTSLVD